MIIFEDYFFGSKGWLNTYRVATLFCQQGEMVDMFRFRVEDRNRYVFLPVAAFDSVFDLFV